MIFSTGNFTLNKLNLASNKGWGGGWWLNPSLRSHLFGGGGGGGHSGTKWLPTAKLPHGAEALNTKILGQSTPLKVLKAKKGGGQLQTKQLIRVVTCKMCLFSLYFEK